MARDRKPAVPDSWPGFAWLFTSTYTWPAIVIIALAAMVGAAVYASRLPWGEDESTATTPTPTAPSTKETPSVTSTASNGSNSLIVGDGSTIGDVTLAPQPPAQEIPEIAGILRSGLHAEEHPFIDPEKPIEDQVRLFAEDKVTFFDSYHGIEEVDFGRGWEPFKMNHEYLVHGIKGEPLTPKFKGGKGSFKFLVRYTKYRDQDRDIDKELMPAAP